jgi:nifR3 family TIM-barrel protein
VQLPISRHTGEVPALLPALRAGRLEIEPPVVLAPMAGITNRAFRRLCRQYGAGLYVSEMVTSRGLVERDQETWDMVRFHPSEQPRSLQLYGIDPVVVAEAVRIVAGEDLADHVDLNFGCPVPKVTRKGGGSALPWKADLFDAIVTAAVRAADGRVPVTVKMRTGIDAEHVTYLSAGEAAARAGASWVALHGRTAEQMYSGRADWDAIARLKEHLAPYDTPVLGNGDIFSAADAVAMVAATGCDGVVVGRGCLGRPWLFGQLAAAFAGGPIPGEPDIDAVIATYRQHAELLVEEFGEWRGCREIRKHHSWYFKGFRVQRQIREQLGLVQSLQELADLSDAIERGQPWPGDAADGPRGRTGPARRVALPEGWLESRLVGTDLDPAAETASSGG